MSAGAFTTSRYVRDNSDIHPIRIQPETASITVGAASNTPSTGTVTSDISVKVSKGNRGLGIKPRTVTFKFTSNRPTDYKAESPITLPCLTPAFYNACVKGATGTYLGGNIEVLYKSPERVG